MQLSKQSMINDHFYYQKRSVSTPKQCDIVLRPSEILLETRSARSKIWVLKLARSLEPLLGLSYRDGDQVQVCSKFARLARKFWVLKLARSLEPPLGLSTNLSHFSPFDSN